MTVHVAVHKKTSETTLKLGVYQYMELLEVEMRGMIAARIEQLLLG